MEKKSAEKADVVFCRPGLSTQAERKWSQYLRNDRILEFIVLIVKDIYLAATIIRGVLVPYAKTH
jgi:hypothetical protein